MPQMSWDFRIERIDLDCPSINGGDNLGMVIVQPEYGLDADGQVPFRISNRQRTAQLDLIREAFRLREIEAQARRLPVPFILFPEMAIPVTNPDGMDCVKEQMDLASGEVIFIGGLEGLTLGESESLLARFPPSIPGAILDTDRAGAFINSCVIVVKNSSGSLSWYYQSKIAPSQWEQPRNMCQGKRLLYFFQRGLAFVCQICSDHIGAQGAEDLNTYMCSSLIRLAEPHPISLNYVFNLQYNARPDDDSFRESRRLILNYADTQFSNHYASVIVCNCAASTQESSQYGRSGIHYRRGRWQIPQRDIGPKGYELFDNEEVTSAVFRKRTAAIHVATLISPTNNQGNSGNPRYPLDSPKSHLIGQGCDATPCICIVDGVQSVVCDCLPCKLRDILPSRIKNHRLGDVLNASDEIQRKSLKTHYADIREQMLTHTCGRSCEILGLLFHCYDHKVANPDIWPTLRCNAVEELVTVLSVLKEWINNITLSTMKPWTALLGNDLAVVVVDGKGNLHWEVLFDEYCKSYRDQYFRSEMRTRAVLFVALRAAGQVDPSVRAMQNDITEPDDCAIQRIEESIDRPQKERFWVCQGSLLEQARSEKSIRGYLQSKMGCTYGQNAS